MANEPAPGRRYVLISPCRDEAGYMGRTLDSVIRQTERPLLWIIIDDGSTDDTPKILAEYASKYDWILVFNKPNRGARAVGPGVIEAFYYGLDRLPVNTEYDFLCKLDLDLDLPAAYFATLMDQLIADPRLGSASGKPYFRNKAGRLISEKIGDELSVGMTKFYRRQCFEDIGGFVREVMWDAIDCHKSRQLGWTTRSSDEPNLRFEHLRPMGSSQKNIFVGRARHGYGQYYMGSDPLYFMATVVYRMAHPPYILGALAMFWGFMRAALTGAARHDDPALRSFIRSYQRRALTVGKGRAIREIEARTKPLWYQRSSGFVTAELAS